MFHRNHAKRLCELAGFPYTNHEEFICIDQYAFDELYEMMQKRGVLNVEVGKDKVEETPLPSDP